MTKRIWTVNTEFGTDPIGPDVQIEYPIDSNLYRHSGWPQDFPGQANSLQDSGLDSLGVPEVLTNLAEPIGSENATGTIDVVLDCTDIPGIVRYEVRLAK